MLHKAEDEKSGPDKIRTNLKGACLNIQELICFFSVVISNYGAIYSPTTNLAYAGGFLSVR